MVVAGGGMVVGGVYHSGIPFEGGAGTHRDVNEFGDWTVAPEGIPVLVTWIDWFGSVTFVEHVDELFESSISS